MKKMSLLDRTLLLITGLLAAYHIAFGVNGLHTLPMISYTIAFGVLLIAGLLLIILGFEILDSSLVVIVSTMIPLSLSVGLVWQYFPSYRTIYLVFAIAGFVLIAGTRLFVKGLTATLTLALIHGIAGMVIFLTPFILALQGAVAPGFALVGVGGALIGLGGLLLSFLKAGRPILARETILTVLPSLLLLMTAAFVAGFVLA